MATKLKLATSIPEFKNSEEAAEFFETHDVSLVWDQWRTVRPFRLPGSQIRQIRERYQRRKQAISLRLERRQVELARQIATRKSIGYQTQLRLWIAEGIRREGRR